MTYEFTHLKFGIIFLQRNQGLSGFTWGIRDRSTHGILYLAGPFDMQQRDSSDINRNMHGRSILDRQPGRRWKI